MTNHDSPRVVLGREVDYPTAYDPGLLCPVHRSLAREQAGIDAGRELFYGEDLWNIYELSWLNAGGRPQVAMAEVSFPFTSPCLIESKSLKLYCNSFNMVRMANAESLTAVMVKDLSAAAGAEVSVRLIMPEDFDQQQLHPSPGHCIDQEEVAVFQYNSVNNDVLCVGSGQVTETVFSRLFRSRCPVTGQPDWATIIVSYRGKQILPGSLLQYLVSYREHQGFHEACVEQIFCDLRKKCRPTQLSVTARFTRRGGLDINPMRSDRPGPWPNCRDFRQ